MDHLSDNELLALAAGEPEAFAVFYDRHAVALIGALRHRTGSTEMALDLAGETFAAVLARCDRFVPADESSGRGWLYAIAQNKLIDAHRRGRVEDRARRRLGMQRVEPSERGVEAVDARIDAERSGVLAALELLPGHERDAVRARILDETTYRDIAEREKTTETVVRQRVSRGLRRLRTILRETP